MALLLALLKALFCVKALLKVPKIALLKALFGDQNLTRENCLLTKTETDKRTTNQTSGFQTKAQTLEELQSAKDL